jgi:hypothetical protein
VFVGARYKHIRIQNIENEALYTREVNHLITQEVKRVPKPPSFQFEHWIPNSDTGTLRGKFMASHELFTLTARSFGVAADPHSPYENFTPHSMSYLPG